MTELIKKSSPIFANNSRNTIVLNGTNNFSLRIEDPKKANFENDVFVKIMMKNVPQINEYFNIIDKIGEGTFSKVYKAKLKLKYCDQSDNPTEEFALKYIIPIVKPVRVAKELRFLRDLGGASNIIPIRACFHNHGHTVIVMPIVEHDRFLDYLQIITVDEIRKYMRSLLEALALVHSRGIIHRDIKPSNFLYNRSTGKCALVDFGLSQSERELCHTINLSLLQSTKNSKTKNSKSISNDSKVRKNLNTNFSTANDKKLKRTFNDMNNVKNEEDNIIKRLKLNHQESSVFISPITPSLEKDTKTFLPKTPVKSNRNPLTDESNNMIAATPVKSSEVNNIFESNLFETPIKTPPNISLDAVKTPVKSMIVVPETPPKTVQKNLHFSKATPPTINGNKENFTAYSTPKSISRPTFQRFVTTKKTLHPELSTMNLNHLNSIINASNDYSQQELLNHRSQNCSCIQTPNICHCCLSKQELNVPRAGTPGFRAPEILLRCQNQSTKIDIWSSGVIFASLLSGRYPFFRCTDDMTCLAEIITVLGSSKVKRAATALNKTLMISRKSVRAMNLKDICVKLKKSSSKLSESATNESENFTNQFPDSAYDLLEHLLDPNPYSRYSAKEALSHPFFTEA